MNAIHFEFLVEEPSMEFFLMEILNNILKNRATYSIHTYQGKSDLLKKLDDRLRGYRKFLPDNHRIVVLIDRGDDDCQKLKKKLETFAFAAGFRTPSNGKNWQLVNRIAVEELEAWFFGEWGAVQKAFDKLPNLTAKAAYRFPDQIKGGTWEALERVFQSKGYFKEGLRKVEIASVIGGYFDVDKCVSPSFICFYKALISALKHEEIL